MTFELHIAPAIAVVAVWWLATGVILWIDHRAAPASALTFAGALALAPAAMGLLWWSTSEPSLTGAYAGFAAAIGLWAFHELTFLMGWITGPSRSACPPGLRALDRLKAAWAVVAHHELALFATLGGVAAISWHAPNVTGLGVFLALFVMRATSKLALFLGAPHAPVAFLPDRMRYLASYFGVGRHRWFLAAVIAAASSVCAGIAAASLHPSATPHDAAQAALIATVLALGVLEHLFLAAPLQEHALWRWAVPRRSSADAAARTP